MLTAAPIMGSAAIVIIILFFYLVHKLWRKKRHLDIIASYSRHAINQFEANVLPNYIRPNDLQNGKPLCSICCSWILNMLEID